MDTLLSSAYTDFENKCNINIFFLYFYIIDNDLNAANPFSNSVQNTIQNFSFLISSIVLQKTLPLIICESGHHILVIAEPSTKKVQTVSFLIPILFDICIRFFLKEIKLHDVFFYGQLYTKCNQIFLS